MNKEKLQQIFWAIENEGFDYYFTEYQSPDFFDFDPELKELVVKYNNLKHSLVEKLDALAEENEIVWN